MTIDLTATGVDPLDALATRIRDRTATTAVVGLGYVGLPLLVGVHAAGFPVIGIDNDEAKIDVLRSHRSHIADIADSEVAAMDRAIFSENPSPLAQAEVVVLCLPTPLADGAPDLTMVLTAAEDVARLLRPGMLVVLESTTYPGTTEELMRPILEASGLRAGLEFALAYSPERIDPGNRDHRLDTTPKVVSGLTDRCRDLAVSFYSSFVHTVVTTSTPREAEMAKLIENTYRQVNIALVNELAVLARDLGVDIWESLHAAATKPFGYQPFWPGPGVGGHCISIDPTYLSWRAGQQLGHRVEFIEHANEVNNRMPDYVVARIAEALNDAGKPIKGSKVLGIGVAFKPGVDDLRESPSRMVLDRLARRGAVIAYHDSFVPSCEIEGLERSSVSLDAATVAGQDIVVLLTPHADVDVHDLVNRAAMVFDARGVTVGIDAPNVVRL
ncbi:MAG: nucleotide sugar dehydrogenase [Actinomycetota bacterium]|nr:nucleotide sugar dehydrogenase [Actinomycetota bacterium]MDH5223557.1 nucleotide sugar dehydrogenase [Actinomycetota bacterium]MDH5312448.1 nucleotide sugar dehydrogenase [Actinomycetota bacterium]